MMIIAQFDPQDFAAMNPLLPQEQAHVKELRDKGTIEALFISADRLHVWLVMKAESQEQLEQELKGFPLYPYTKAQFVPLL
ncbi:MAG TPA: muconolactone Delta-isomerase family protein [Ktedonobacteraceae bacterium]